MTVLLVLLACAQRVDHAVLEPYPNPFGPGDDLWAEQPPRLNPLEIVVAGDRAWVGLQGSVDEPGGRVVAVDLASFEVVDGFDTAPGTTGIALHPDGERILALGRFGSWATVADARSGRVLGEIATDFYATEAVFTPAGDEIWVTNRWRDAVQIWEVDPEDPGLAVVAREELPVGVNPRDVAISADGRRVAVAALTGMEVSLFDVEAREEIARIDVGAPANGVAFAGDWLIVPTLSASTHHAATFGPDGDGDGAPGDGTPNVNFQDLQNEIAVYRASDGAEAWRYTSDTICCKDYRDVDPDDLSRGGDLLPPRSTWIVGGALPEQVVADGTDVYVTYSGSDQAQRFTIDLATGALTPGPVGATGHAPHGLAVAGGFVLVTHRLGETLGRYDRELVAQGEVVVGDVSGGEFPATDAEIGELINHVTAPFTVDGDQVCAACHRESGNIDKALSMPLFAYPGMGSRMVMAYRGAADTRPWFFESSMDETNFRPVINEFARIENFCCSDPTLWPTGAPPDCEADPPGKCGEPNPGSPDGFGVARGVGPDHPRPTAFVSRDLLFRAAALQVVGRSTTFGDALVVEDVETGETAPLPLHFDGVTSTLGLFLLQDPALLPNPNDPETASARRGRALFERADVGCAGCHPGPAFTVSTDNNPGGMPIQMGAVVSPTRSEDGTNLDLFSAGFLATFPLSASETCEDVCDPVACGEDPAVCDDIRDVRLGVPSLRGLWDRAPSLLHDGRARGLREVLCTPGHPALRPGETGFNERDGMPDTHGATSHLTPQQVDDLAAYLLTL